MAVYRDDNAHYRFFVLAPFIAASHATNTYRCTAWVRSSSIRRCIELTELLLNLLSTKYIKFLMNAELT